MQVRVREAESYVRLDTVGGAEGMTKKPITYQNITRYVAAHWRGITRVLLARIYMNSYFIPCFSHVKVNTLVHFML